MIGRSRDVASTDSADKRFASSEQSAPPAVTAGDQGAASIRLKHVQIVGVSAGLLLLDYLTGKNIQFPILFIVPVAWSSWCGYQRMAIGLAILLPCARLAFYIPWQETVFYFGIANTAIRMIILTGIAFLVREHRRVQELNKQVKVLSGVLPICAACKRIRNTKGEYQQLEVYVRDHSEAEFTHGMCPECLKEYYPELAERICRK